MENYVVSFLFTPDFEAVWLIQKQKPEWQKGCLNGIGGKIEQGEDPIISAKREIYEESGLLIPTKDLRLLGTMKGVNNDETPFEVYVYTGVTEETLETQEEEEIYQIPVKDIKEYNRIENVPMLIEACIYLLTGKSHFQRMDMLY